MNTDKILKSNLLLTVICVITAINLIGYVSIAAYECLLVFVLAGYALKNFTPYISLQLFGGLLIANILFGCGRARNMNEGFAGKITEVVTGAQKKVKDFIGKLKPE